MTKKLKFGHIFTHGSFSYSVITKLCMASVRTSQGLHFIHWLLRCTLCLERIMDQSLKFPSISKQIFEMPYLCQLLMDLNE